MNDTVKCEDPKVKLRILSQILLLFIDFAKK